MKKLKLIMVSGFVSLLFIGCAGDQPSFDPNNKSIAVVAGNVYLVPLEVEYNLEPFKSENDKGMIKARQAGLDCRKGDILWISSEVKKTVREARLDGDVNRAASIVIEAPRKGYVGCAHPLSRKEFEDYQRKHQK